MSAEHDKKIAFLSGTRRDLRGFFEKTAEAINALDQYKTRSMDNSSPEDTPVDRWSRREGTTPDVLVGLVGHYYGNVPEGSNQSLTEQEYEMAGKVGIERLMFLTEQGDRDLIDKQSESSKVRVQAFRARIEKECTYTNVSAEEEFATKAVQALQDWERRTLAGATVKPDDYFAPLLTSDNVLGHRVTLIGQSDTLKALADFESSRGRILVLHAPWGRGKSRVILEHTRTSKVPVRFVREDITPSRHNLDMTPIDPVTIVLEDAHKRDHEDIVNVLTFLARCGPQVKLVVTTRNAMARDVTTLAADAGFSAESVVKHAIPPLSDEEQERLAAEILGQTNEVAHVIASRTKGNTLACVIASRLFHGGQMSMVDVEGHGEFIHAVVDRYRSIVDSSLSEDYKHVLRLVAAVAPIRPGDDESAVALAAFLGKHVDEFRRLVNNLQDMGLLLRRGRLVRIPVDAVSESELLAACVDQHGESTGYADRMLAALWGVSRRQILRNLAIADWEAAQSGYRVALFRQVWPRIRHEYEQSPPTARQILLEELEDVAALKPEETLAFIRHAMSSTSAPEEEHPILRGYPRDQWIHEAMAKLLRVVAHVPALLAQACDLLWNLAKEDKRPPHQNPYSAERTLRGLGAYRRRDLPHYEAFVSWAESGAAAIPGVRLVEYVAPLLARESEHDWADDRSIHMSSSGISYALVAPLRRRVLDLLQKLAQHDTPTAAARAIAIMGEALAPPRGLFGRIVSDREREQWKPEELDVLERFRAIRLGTSSPTIYISLLKELVWPSEHATSPRVAAQARVEVDECRAAIAGTVEAAVVAPFELDYNPFDDERHKQVVSETASRICKSCHDGLDVLDVIKRADEELWAMGRQAYPDALLKQVAQVRPDWGKVWIDHIVANSGYPLGRTVDAIIEGMSRASVEEGKSATEHVVRHGDNRVLAVLAWSFRLPGWIAIVGEEIICGYFHDLLRHPEQMVQYRTLDAIGFNREVSAQRRLSLLLGFDLISSRALGEEWAQALVGSKLCDLSTPEQCAEIAQKLIAASKLDYWGSRLIAHLCRVVPGQTIEMLLARIRSAAEYDRGLDAIPHHYQANPFADLPPTERENLMTRLGPHFGGNFAVAHAARTLFAELGAGAPESRRSVRRAWVDAGDIDSLNLAVMSFQEEEPESLFEEEETVVALLRAAEVIGPDMQSTVQSSMLTVAFRGIRTGKPGEPMPRDVDIKVRARALADRQAPMSVESRFYRRLEQNMERHIADDVARFVEESI